MIAHTLPIKRNLFCFSLQDYMLYFYMLSIYFQILIIVISNKQIQLILKCDQDTSGSMSIPGVRVQGCSKDAAIVATLINVNRTTHVVPPTPAPLAARVERVPRPTVTAAGTSEDLANNIPRNDHCEIQKIIFRLPTKHVNIFRLGYFDFDKLIFPFHDGDVWLWVPLQFESYTGVTGSAQRRIKRLSHSSGNGR